MFLKHSKVIYVEYSEAEYSIELFFLLNGRFLVGKRLFFQMSPAKLLSMMLLAIAWLRRVEGHLSTHPFVLGASFLSMSSHFDMVLIFEKVRIEEGTQSTDHEPQYQHSC
jgi:hypothetical protein